MKSVLLDLYLSKNLGDDLFLKILVERYPNIKWTIICERSDFANMFRNYKNVEFKNINIFWKFIRKLKIFDIRNYYNNSENYDALVFIGGSIFMQKGNYNQTLAYRKNLIESFRNSNKPIFILGSNFGEFFNDYFKEEYDKIFEICTDVCFRDNYSYELFNHLNNVRVAPDIIFALKESKVEKNKDSIGISIINLEDRNDLAKYSDQYENKMVELIQSLIINGKEVTLFSFCESEGDMKSISRIITKIDRKFKDNIKVVNYTGDIKAFLNEYKKQEEIIGCRFHSIILSQIFDQGVYPLIYSNKTLNVLNDCKINKYYSHIKDIANLNIKLLLEVISNNKIKSLNILKESENHFKELDRFCNG